jgi:hypothetical protein
MDEAAQEREEAGKRAREDEETHMQMREARVEFDVVRDAEDCDPEINDEGRQNYEHPGDREIVELQESDEEDPHHSEVSSNACTSPAHVLECKHA